MKRKLLALILVGFMVFGILPLTAYAADGDGDGYDDNDFDKLQTFLNQSSAVPGETNGQRINPLYNPTDPATWTGVIWNGDVSKRVTSIGADGSTWSSKSLSGNLDVSGFSALLNLNCGYNSIASLNVSGCPALQNLLCNNNALTTLDTGTSAGLVYLNCSCNQLSTLNLDGYTGLRQLNCNDNMLSELDLSGNAQLEELICYNNQLSALNLNENILLQTLECHNNQITTLDLSANTDLYGLNCSGNPLTHIQASILGAGIVLNANGKGYAELMITEEIYATAAPRTGASLACWTEFGAQVGTDARYDINFEQDYNLVANFNPFDVTFDSQGGSAVPGASADYNTTVSEPDPDPTRPGHTFGGWYKEAACTNAWDFANDAVTTDITLFAKWTESSNPEPPTAHSHKPDLTLSMSPSDGKIYTGGRVTITPNIGGGTWSFDESYLSRDGYTFTGLKAGTARVTYTAGEQSAHADIVISQSELPATGQDFTPALWLLIAGAFAGCGFIALYIGKRRRERA